ncbi:hypothetical protein BKA81DRAFT_349945 [Phyllosticta paracitricarpa]
MYAYYRQKQREEDCAVWLSSIMTWICGAWTPNQIDGKNIYTHSPCVCLQLERQIPTQRWQTAVQPPAVVRIYPARRHGAGGTWWMHGPASYLHLVASLRGGARSNRFHHTTSNYLPG